MAKKIAPAKKTPAKAPEADQASTPAADAPEASQRVADALRDPSFVASLGLRNGMTPEAIEAAALRQLGE